MNLTGLEGVVAVAYYKDHLHLAMGGGWDAEEVRVGEGEAALQLLVTLVAALQLMVTLVAAAQLLVAVWPLPI